jgi:hypothetical protein
MSDDMHGRALDTWRVIPEFEKYEMNLVKHIRYVENKQYLYPSLTGNDVAFYHMNTEEPGRVVLMNENHILDITFPELRN